VRPDTQENQIFGPKEYVDGPVVLLQGRAGWGFDCVEGVLNALGTTTACMVLFLNYEFLNKLLATGRGYLLKCSGGQIQSGEAL
jgi:hypothetical protein